MSAAITIHHRPIGNEHPCFVIAEAGVNHNGDVRLAKQLVVAAKRCGADCVKFQTFKAERAVTETAPKAQYQLQTTDPKESQMQMLKKLELPFEAYQELLALCQAEGILFLSTPYNVEDVEFLSALHVEAFKLSSICLAEPYFLQYVAKQGKPIILSTGMGTLAEIDEAVRVIRATGNNQIILMQCTTNYPSAHKDANLLVIKTMQQAFRTVVGYSDHTQDEVACIASIALGAKVIEKHFTIDKTLPGPDQSSSADPVEFSRLVQHIRNAELALGSSLKEPCEVERKNALGMRRSIVTKRRIEKGEVIDETMLTFKRPATGLPPRYLGDLVGGRASRNMDADYLLRWSDIDFRS